MKKLTAILVSVLMLLTVLLPAASALTPAESAHLHFNEDGKFKILNFSDFQDNASLSSLTADFIRKSIEVEQPDLIVLTGDNIAGYGTTNKKASEKAIRAFMEVLQECGVPVAPVFGNHDDQGNMTKEDQMKVYRDYSVCIGFDEAEFLAEDPAYGGKDVAGVGTYVVPIYESAAADAKVKFAAWMFDTGSDDAVEKVDNYDHVHADQIDWYRAKRDALYAENGEYVSGIAFQHIVPVEIYDALKKVDRSVQGAVPYQKEFYVLPETASADSVLGEAPCPSYGNEGQVDAFLEQGDVKAVVFGHDHANSYQIPYEKDGKSIDLICTATCGFYSYGKAESRGARVIELSLDNPNEFTTRTYLFTDIFADNAGVMLRYRIVNFFKEIALFFNNLWVRIRESF